MEVAAFHPLPEGSDSSLWPCSSPSRRPLGLGCCGRALPGILLCGARTFLSPGITPGAATIWQASRGHYRRASARSAVRRPSTAASARAQRHDARCAECERLRHRPGSARKRDRIAVARQVIERRAVHARKAFEPIERTRILERFRIKGHGDRRRIAARTAARMLFGVLRVGRGIGAEKEFRIARCRGRHERLPMRLALEYGQAIEMRAQAAREQCVARIEQVLRRNRRRNTRGTRRRRTARPRAS